MKGKQARAKVEGLRQSTQFTCMATSVCAAIRAWGNQVTEEEVNRVMGCQALQGASWEDALGTAQYFGMRGTLVVPATLEMLRDWTSRGIPVLIAWNPEGRPWSHASTVYDVDAADNVYVMDPNIPDPDQTTRVVPRKEFFKKWSESVGDKLIIRRPAMAVEREITSDGRQVMANLGSAREDYFQAVTHLETSVDLVATATNKLRSLGHEPRDEEYPFMSDIEVVASDIYRWKGELDRKFTNGDQIRVAHRVAQKYLRRQKP